jgi:hypothetical protein
MNNYFKKIVLLLIDFINKLKKNSTSRIFIVLSNLLILNSRKFYNQFSFLEDAELKIFSQNGEDGIIDFIIKKLNLRKPNFVEIGVGDYSEANTRFLYETYYSQGLIIDSVKNFKKKIAPNINIWRGNLKILEKKVSSKNINNILSNYAKFKIDIFSIDIDGIDYWIINEIKPKISKIFILEYNYIFGSKLEVTVPNIKNFNRTQSHYSNLYYGASLKAYIKLMNKKGYYFLGVNRMRNNAFFINEDYPKIKFFNNIKNLNLSHCTNANFNESRNSKGQLNYLDHEDKIRNIKNCKLVNLIDNKKKLFKIKDLI